MCHSAAVSDGAFDERIAAGYDEACGPMNAPEILGPTVDVLVDLAGEGRALEFAIGTGRVALPLLERGVEVHGIELSRAMVAQLRAKAGGNRIPVEIGDMTSTRVDGTFSLVYLVYNTISNLLTQQEQVACFRNAAGHLAPGGHFLIEVGIPALRRLPLGESLVTFEASDDHVGIDEYDVATQRLVSHHYWIRGDSVERFDSHHRYAWPAEYDLMARLAGMEPAHRWQNWHRDPFTGESTAHVSTWTRTDQVARGTS